MNKNRKNKKWWGMERSWKKNEKKVKKHCQKIEEREFYSPLLHLLTFVIAEVCKCIILVNIVKTDVKRHLK